MITPCCVNCTPSSPGRAGGQKSRNLDPAPAPFQPHVGRLDISVHDAALMRRRQAFGNLAANAQHFGNRQPALAMHAVV